MDPDGLLEEIEGALERDDDERAAELCERVRDWLERGGYAPAWYTAPSATRHYHLYYCDVGFP